MLLHDDGSAGDGRDIAFGQGETVLLVERSEALRKLGQSVLEKLNYRVLTALGKNDLLAQQYLSRERIDLLILDTGLPKNDGQEIITAVRRQQPEARILFAASNDPAICSECCEYVPAELIINKPYSVQGLSRTIYQTLR